MEVLHAESSCQAPEVVTELGAFVGYSAVRFSSALRRHPPAVAEFRALRDHVNLGSWVYCEPWSSCKDVHKWGNRRLRERGCQPRRPGQSSLRLTSLEAGPSPCDAMQSAQQRRPLAGEPAARLCGPLSAGHGRPLPSRRGLSPEVA